MNDLEFLFWKNYNGKIIHGIVAGTQSILSVFTTITPTTSKFCFMYINKYSIANVLVPNVNRLFCDCVDSLSNFYYTFILGSSEIQNFYNEFKNTTGSYFPVNGTNNITIRAFTRPNYNLIVDYDIYYTFILFD